MSTSQAEPVMCPTWQERWKQSGCESMKTLNRATVADSCGHRPRYAARRAFSAAAVHPTSCEFCQSLVDMVMISMGSTSMRASVRAPAEPPAPVSMCHTLSVLITLSRMVCPVTTARTPSIVPNTGIPSCSARRASARARAVLFSASHIVSVSPAASCVTIASQFRVGWTCVHQPDGAGRGAYCHRERHGVEHGLPSRPLLAGDVAGEPRMHGEWAPVVGIVFDFLHPLKQHLLVIASHAQRDAPAFHPGDRVDASWSAVDEVTEGEETVAPGEEPDAREHRLERVELAVHVADHEITASGRIGSHAGE